MNRNVTTVSIQRDYRDIITKFEMQPFPEELSRNGVSLVEFENTINEINRLLERAETVDSRSVFEECIGCLTFFSIFLFYDDKYKKCIKRITEFIDRENESLYNPKGITWVNPVSNGFLKIDIIVRLSNSNSSTPSTIPTSIVNNNNNNQNSNNNNDELNNFNNNNNDKTSFRTPTKLPSIDDKLIQKPETIINVITNNNIVELSDDEDDEEDNQDLILNNINNSNNSNSNNSNTNNNNNSNNNNNNNNDNNV